MCPARPFIRSVLGQAIPEIMEKKVLVKIQFFKFINRHIRLVLSKVPPILVFYMIYLDMLKRSLLTGHHYCITIYGLTISTVVTNSTSLYSTLFPFPIW